MRFRYPSPPVMRKTRARPVARGTGAARGLHPYQFNKDGIMRNIALPAGDQMPALGLGTWKMSEGQAYDAVKMAIENGYRHIDCAWIYLNEADVGRALQDTLNAGSVSRQDLWITSKLWNDRHQPEQVATALKESLTQLRLDYLDLYLIHWPVAHQLGKVRPETAADYLSLEAVPVAETWQAMLECMQAGLCRNVGVSNFSIPKLEQLIRSSGVAPACNQVESHPYLQQSALLEFCRAQQIAFTAYSPLGSGDRPDNMKQDDEPNLFDDETIGSIASQHQLTPAQVMLAWAVNRGTIPIPKSANSERQQQNLAAADVTLTPGQMQQINALDRHHRFVDGTFWEIEGGPYNVSNLWDEPG